MMIAGIKDFIAGPDLDALVSQLVFGENYRRWDSVKINDVWRNVTTWLPEGYEPHSPPGGTYPGIQPPPHSTNIEYASRVIDRLSSRWDEIYLILHFGDWFAKAMNYDYHGVVHEPSVVQTKVGRRTAAHAICILALRVINHEHEHTDELHRK